MKSDKTVIKRIRHFLGSGGPFTNDKNCFGDKIADWVVFVTEKKSSLQEKQNIYVTEI